MKRVLPLPFSRGRSIPTRRESGREYTQLQLPAETGAIRAPEQREGDNDRCEITQTPLYSDGDDDDDTAAAVTGVGEGVYKSGVAGMEKGHPRGVVNHHPIPPPIGSSSVVHALQWLLVGWLVWYWFSHGNYAHRTYSLPMT